MSNKMEDLIECFNKKEQRWNFEGDSGLERLNKLFGAMGYEKDNFLYGSPLEKFLSDNPGAIEAILNWVISFQNDEWVENLQDYLGEENEGKE